MRRVLLIATGFVLIASPTFAQVVVIDPANLYQAILIAERTLSEYNTLVQQYATIVRMSRSLGSLDRYRTRAIAITGHDPGRWPYGEP